MEGKVRLYELKFMKKRGMGDNKIATNNNTTMHTETSASTKPLRIFILLGNIDAGAMMGDIFYLT